MEIFEHKGDMLNVGKGILVHGCNNQGVMGSGIAKAIRDRYPKVFKDYDYFMKSGYKPPDRMGRVVLTTLKERELYVISGITQNEYGNDKTKVYVDYKAMEHVFREANYYAQNYNLDLHFPLIGCGLANGDWNKVSEIIEKVVNRNVRKHLWVL